LKMEYETKNDCIKWCNVTLCNWGQRKPAFDANQTIVGSPTPLWLNPSKTFFVLFFTINFIVSILFVSSFVAITFYNNSQLSINATTLNSTNTNSTNTNSTNTNSTNTNTTNTSALTNTSTTNATNTSSYIASNDLICMNTITSRLGSFFIVIGSIILFFNALYHCYLYNVEFATDEEWSRYLTFEGIALVCLVGFDIGDYIWCIQNIQYFTNNSGTNQLFTMPGVSVCPSLFHFNTYCNIVVAVLISVISVFQGFKISANYKELFFPKEQDEYRARCDDPDIIILARN